MGSSSSGSASSRSPGHEVTGSGTEMTADVAAAFDEAADRYDSAGPQFAGPVASRLVGLARLQPGWRGLDAGGGAGAVLIQAAPAGGPGRPRCGRRAPPRPA